MRSLLGAALAAGLLLGVPGVAAADVPDLQWPPAGVVEPFYPASQLQQFADRLSDRLDVRFPAAMGPVQDLNWTPWGGEFAGVIEDRQDYLTTFAVYSDAIGRTGVSFELDAPGRFTSSPRDVCALDGVVSCTAQFLPDGSLLVDRLDEFDFGKEDVRHAMSVFHYRLDGGLTWVIAYDYDPIFDGDEGPVRDDIAVSTEVLNKLAEDPGLHL